MCSDRENKTQTYDFFFFFNLHVGLSQGGKRCCYKLQINTYEAMKHEGSINPTKQHLVSKVKKKKTVYD